MNRDPLDNRRCNLRIVTPGENSQNQGPRSGSISGIRNVEWNTHKKRYEVRLWVDGRRLNFGRYRSAEDAGRAAEQARRLYMPGSREYRAAHGIVES